MKCPHCSITVHVQPSDRYIDYHNTYTGYAVRACLCPACGKYILWLGQGEYRAASDWQLIEPPGSNRGPVPIEVPRHVAEDYVEACTVQPLSAKASAALSRRCLQIILRDHGYKAKDLSKEIDLLLSESDPTKAIPTSLRHTVDGIRNFGNFSAHPVTDQTTLQIIDVEPHEAEWCLEILEEMFQHFYVRPTEARKRKAALDAKLNNAGKPVSK